ncbi:hypothetical protein A3B45_05150 [Candidatus Daviesbacteria bacterium RIFCSPLOWO2_01_FULL_39_12]|uniref:Uncharacterized protein n=1 Tax=Candidatus Daviesbacteria bacterium RIFCSPLOWO2_01_FULL_39_12 TaxID=1797785 RepID=A0A1F5KUA7_9BACT|nr:MAG: hypothetical protein A3B45_05150 [Candidatus Daviesbacteria bacterium RIFCSPLOWO2_01_FULL_39_12]
MRNLSKAAKALILTWVVIGLIVAGGIGFYLGRTTTPRMQSQPPTMQNQDGLRDIQQPIGGQQPPPGTNQGPLPSGAAGQKGPAPQGGQQSPPPDEGQPSIQR